MPERAREEPLRTGVRLQAERRLRPFARRRASTARPFFVLMRTRKPCVLFRWRLFGWNVRFDFDMGLPLRRGGAFSRSQPLLSTGRIAPTKFVPKE